MGFPKGLICSVCFCQGSHGGQVGLHLFKGRELLSTLSPKLSFALPFSVCVHEAGDFMICQPVIGHCGADICAHAWVGLQEERDLSIIGGLGLIFSEPMLHSQADHNQAKAGTKAQGSDTRGLAEAEKGECTLQQPVDEQGAREHEIESVDFEVHDGPYFRVRCDIAQRTFVASGTISSR